MVWVPPSGVSATPTWASLSEGAKQAVFESGLLKDELEKAALGSGIRGILAPGTLASQGLGNLTVFGAGGTVGVVNNANLSAYTKDCKWQFKFGKWLCVLDGVAYFPSNIPAATNPRSIPVWRVGPDGIGEWIFRSDASPTPSPSPSQSPLANNPPPPPPPQRPNGNRPPIETVVDLVNGVRELIDRDSGVVGPGRLTSQEAEQIQRIANRYNTEIHVVGSRAAGQGRNIDTDLPVDKGEGTRSDIDMRIDGQADIDSGGRLSEELINVGGEAGNVRPFIGLGGKPGTYPPVIIFRPNQPPIVNRG